MKNRDRYILKQNEYDVLCKIQLALLYGENCIISALTAKDYSCPKHIHGEQRHERCCRCLQQWLNEES